MHKDLYENIDADILYDVLDQQDKIYQNWCEKSTSAKRSSQVQVTYHWVGDKTRTYEYFSGKFLGEYHFTYPKELHDAAEWEGNGDLGADFYFDVRCDDWIQEGDQTSIGLEPMIEFTKQKELIRTVEIPKELISRTDYCHVHPRIACSFFRKGGSSCWYAFPDVQNLYGATGNHLEFEVHGRLEYCIDGVVYEAPFDDGNRFGQPHSGYTAGFYLLQLHQ